MMRKNKIVTRKYQLYPSGDVYNLHDKWLFKIEDPFLMDFIDAQKFNRYARKAELDDMLDDREEGLRRGLEEWRAQKDESLEPVRDLLEQIPPRPETPEPDLVPEEPAIPKPCEHFLSCKKCVIFHAHFLS